MKVIDLLNKIANGEQPPKKVKYKTHYWQYNEKDRDYIDEDGDYVFNCSNCEISEMLNNEAEIMEEDKKIEKFTEYELKHSMVNEYILGIKINELIDKINEMEGEK